MKTKRLPLWHKNPVHAVEQLLMQAEEKLKAESKFTVGDYLRLLQMREELEQDEPKNIEVSWIEDLQTREPGR